MDQVLKATDIQQQIQVLLNNILLNQTDYENRIRLKEKLQEILLLNHFECVLHFLGSTVNKLGFRDSDIDLFIELAERKFPQTDRISFEEAMPLLTRVQHIFKKSLKIFVPKPIPSIRCPIVRLDFKEMSQNLKTNGIVCDLSLSNGLGPQNSKLIRVFCDIEPRFQQLAVILRYWAKINGFIGSNEMSSYAFTQLVIFFCQNLSPPLLPTVDYLRQLTSETLVIDGWNCSFCDNASLIQKNQQNSENVFDLLQKFFIFYSTFDFTTQVICPKTGSSQHKMDFISTNLSSEEESSNFKLTSICCIQDPFDLSHNLTASLRPKVFHKLTEYFKYISMSLKTIFKPNKEDVCRNDKGKHWGISHIITEFDPTDGYVFPENFIGFTNLDLILNTTESILTLNDLIQTTANNLSDLMVFLLKNVYKIDCLLLGKWDIIVDELSPFAEFYVKFRGCDFQVIDFTIRDSIQSELNQKELEMNYFDREKVITEKIIEKFDSRNDIIPIHCQFSLITNARISFPTFEITIVDIKPSFDFGKGVVDFIKRVIASAAHQQKVLTVNRDLI